MEVEGGNWTRDDSGKWTPSPQDEGAFLLEGERIGELVRTNVTLHNGDDVPCDGVVIGVGRVQAEDGTYQACTRVTYKPPQGVDAIDIQEDLWETEFQGGLEGVAEVGEEAVDGPRGNQSTRLRGV